MKVLKSSKQLWKRGKVGLWLSGQALPRISLAQRKRVVESLPIPPHPPISSPFQVRRTFHNDRAALKLTSPTTQDKKFILSCVTKLSPGACCLASSLDNPCSLSYIMTWDKKALFCLEQIYAFIQSSMSHLYRTLARVR